jgi:SAM-dependent methyltransferase
MRLFTRDAGQPDWAGWLERWDRQQESHVMEREDRFAAVIETVAALTGKLAPYLLDLGCGPGSLSARLLERMPAARVVAVDNDPLLLAIGRGAYADRYGERLRFVQADLRDPSWTHGLELDRPLDAVVSTTALHWLSEKVLRRLYAELASRMRAGGAFVDGDDFETLPGAPRLSAAAAVLPSRLRPAGARREQAAGTPVEDWSAWWAAAAAEPAFAPLFAERDRRGTGHPGWDDDTGWHDGREDGHGAAHGRAHTDVHQTDAGHRHGHGPGGSLSVHVEALRAAGFAEVGTLWQVGTDTVLAAVR